MNDEYDVIVIGCGVAGMTAAIYLKRANLKSLIIEQETPGGLLNKISMVENYPGFKQISGPDLAQNMYEQISDLDIECYYSEVTGIESKETIKIVKTKEQDFKTKAIIIASGRIPKKLNKEKEEILFGHGISFCSLCDGPLYKNQDVAIIGGGNSALEESLYLASICHKVTIVQRKDKFVGEKTLIDKVLNTDNIDVLYNSEIDSFDEKNGILNFIKIKKEDKIINLKVKACFVFIGYEPNTKFLSNLDILDEKGYIIVDKNYRTKEKKIYAAGDIVKKEVFQIVNAASDGALAAVTCIKDLS